MTQISDSRSAQVTRSPNTAGSTSSRSGRTSNLWPMRSVSSAMVMTTLLTGRPPPVSGPHVVANVSAQLIDDAFGGIPNRLPIVHRVAFDNVVAADSLDEEAR